MILYRFIQERRWWSLFGYTLFIGMMAAGYYYNITLVQLGLVDLGQRSLGLAEAAVANYLAAFAAITSAIAIGFGWWMMRREPALLFKRKLKLAFWIISFQAVLTIGVVLVQGPYSYGLWILLTAIAVGVGVPVTFSMTADLIPTPDRGYVAMLITAIAYLAANVLPARWTMEVFRTQMLWLMLPGAALFGILAFGPWPSLDHLSSQHENPLFGRGRYVKPGQSGRLLENPRILSLIVLMFFIFFIDSLGFLRMIETPALMLNTWRAAELQPRLFIGSMHVIGAVIAGILYTRLDDKVLFLVIFGLFALVHQGYGMQKTLFPGGGSSLGIPMLYALAVSMYTVVNFAIWADISTARTISLNSAVGVALSGWTATFLSSGIAIRWRVAGLPLVDHLRRVDALAWLLFLAVLVLIFVPRKSGGSYP